MGRLADKYVICIGLAASVVSDSSSVETLRPVLIVNLFPVTLRECHGMTSDWRDLCQSAANRRSFRFRLFGADRHV